MLGKLQVITIPNGKKIYLKTFNNFLNVKNILNTSKKLKAEFSQTLLRNDEIIKYNKNYLIVH